MRHQILLKLLRASPLVWFFAFFLFSLIVLFPITGRQQQATIDQFNQLPQLPDARRIDYDVLHKPDFVAVNGSDYLTEKDYSGSPESLDAEFIKRGWQISNDRQTSAPGRDYCKNDYSASVDYYGSQYGGYYGTQYTVYLFWGNGPHCRTTQGGARLVLNLIQLLFPLGAAISWAIYAVIIGRATWTLKKTDFNEAMNGIMQRPSIGKA